MTPNELRLALDLALARKQINLLNIALNDMAAREQDRVIADLERQIAAGSEVPAPTPQPPQE